ncbi:MAG: response regulator [Clostridia bacterium]|nr:response regulator [Clostridia bacterium]NCC44241.1 response regulator [Clostridia bacterium]
MRIVIAEDEPKSREGLINIIQRFTDYEIVGVAENGEDGYKITTELKPDLVISDIRMPVLDGLGMLQKIKESQIDVQAILLTGYSEFEYARRALQLQVVEYVLKPLEIDQFLSILKKAEGKVQKKNAERLTPDQLLWSYVVSSEVEKERMQPMLEEELGVNDRIISTMFLIHPDSIASETYGEIRKQLQHTLEALCMENYYLLVRPGESGGVFALLIDTERNRSLKSIFVRRIIPQLQEISGCVCSMVQMHGVRQINQVMDELVALLKYSFSIPEGDIIDKETAQMIVYEKLDYPSSLENEMIQYIRNGKRERILEKGEEFAKLVIDSKASPECIRDYTVRFVVGILRIIGDVRRQLNQEEEIQYMMGSINKSHTQREVRYQFEKILKNVAVLDNEDETAITENGIVLNAISYIRENYGKNIGLYEVAQFCNVRSEYLSRIFKEETGVKFVDFLTNFRISVAKRLLYSGNYKVVEVAEMVGFADQKYFQKVFKKVCGVTPSEYKKENCR